MWEEFGHRKLIAIAHWKIQKPVLSRRNERRRQAGSHEDQPATGAASDSVSSPASEGFADQKQREGQLRPANLEQSTPAKVKARVSGGAASASALFDLHKVQLLRRTPLSSPATSPEERQQHLLFVAGDQPDLADQFGSVLQLIVFNIFLVDLVYNGGSESCLRLRPRTRENSGKRVAGSHKLRVGSWNIGSLTGKSVELVKILKKRRINIACVQETKWVGSKARDVDGFKLWYSGGSRDRNGVGILVDGDLREQVVEVRRISDRLMTIKLVIGGCTLSVISAYAPQVGLDEEAKKLFYEDLDGVVRGISNTEKIVIGGDFNGHIGATSNGFDDVHGGFGVGERNGGGI
ncbi:hypothetical protein H5410_061482 [Solanum commersonii]|uniref:Endonuclease/exonuclease/phosphatase domain-containing protein n=1 Tax=Solanum commersonii TaxID=4109 RepID=A0A9J5W8Z8_SOLCO|nr:hypothetical protein H5410_061482 [Solanum commersonii]